MPGYTKAEPNKNYFFTFGVGQYGGLLATYFVKVISPNAGAARVEMHKAFGTGWAFQYEDNKHWTELVKKHGYKQLGTLRVP